MGPGPGRPGQTVQLASEPHWHSDDATVTAAAGTRTVTVTPSQADSGPRAVGPPAGPTLRP